MDDTIADLTIPEISPDDDNLGAALKYAKAGWYVLPVKRGTKHPGSVVGKHWQDKSSREPKMIASWFAGTDHGIALHCGRSGAVVLDVDRPELVPESVAAALKDEGVPYQSSRPDAPRRGHYVFAMPPGRTIGNSKGKLPGGWGEVRGLNGVIIVAPSHHKDGGQYRWLRTGVVPVLPEAIAEMLPEGKPGEDSATDAEVKAFLAKHTRTTVPEGWLGPVRELEREIDVNVWINGKALVESRHDATVKYLVWAMDEAAAGCYPAKDAVDAIKAVFMESVIRQRIPDDKVRTECQAADEFKGILAWCVGQANAKTADQLAAIRTKCKRNMKDGHVIDKPEATGFHAIEWQAASGISDGIPDWAWHFGGKGRLQRGTVVLFAGRPSAGKSTAARYFAAGYSNGTVGGCFENEPQHVAYIAAEESIKYMVKPSLRAHGAELSRIHFPTVRFAGQEVSLQSVRDEELLTAELIAKGITVVFVDPIMSTIESSVDVHRTNQTRAHVEPWRRIAEAINGLVIGIVHLRKELGNDVLAAINGSSAFGEIARGVIAFARDKHTEERVLSQEKNNAGHDDLALCYSIGSTIVRTDEGDAEVGKFVLGDWTTRRVSDVLKANAADERLGPIALEVLEAVRELGKPTGPSDLARLVEGLNNDMAGKYLRRLANQGLLVKNGRGLFSLPGWK